MGDGGGSPCEQHRRRSAPTPPLRALRQERACSSAYRGGAARSSGALLACAGRVRSPPTCGGATGGRCRCAVCWPSSAGSPWPSRSSRRLGFSGVLTGVAARAPSGSTSTGTAGSTRCRGLILVYTVLPDPADGDRVPPGAGGPAAAVARGGGQPRRLDPAVWRHVALPAAARRRSWGRRCCCSPTRSRRTPPRRRWSARAAPIMPLLIRAALTSEVVLGQAELRATRWRWRWWWWWRS